MKIMIGGGYDDTSDAAEHTSIATFARRLAEHVIIQRHELRCGNLSGLDAVVIESACDTADEEGIDPDQVVISYAPKGATPRNPRGGVRDSSNDDWNSMSGRRPSIPEPIAEADVVILIGGVGGGTGTYTAANWARQTGTPLLPVATFGMAAADIFDDVKREPDRQRITGLGDDDLTRLSRNLAMVRSDDQIEKYAELVISLAEKAGLSREVFVAMSFADDPALVDYLDAIKQACAEAKFDADRVDNRPHGATYEIVQKIHAEIERCGFVVADLTGERPNVYYEIGYARGLGKPVILTTRKGATPHFDVAGLHRIEWEGHKNLREGIAPQLRELGKRFGISED